MKIIEQLNLRYFSFLGTLVLSIYALYNKEISVFYMLYLFWWQALIEIFTVIIINFKKTKNFINSAKLVSSSFFLMFIYFIFIIVLFGFVFAFRNEDLIMLNFQVFFFRNTTFNLNILLMLIFAVLYFNSEKNIFYANQNFGVFSNRMLILHVSIILGAVIHFGSQHFLDVRFTKSIYFYIISALPFLIIKSIFEWHDSL
ncbi:hypothetical protein SAMN05421847_0404 [Halpernia humi]|uniref:Uncharacterized protein n=1 Tax=Halpernia humi TaxID=493375 RepID=A0A1H5TBA7_9FLAO|nr:hypothetical protein [Halpernia humi]SEF59351.1 hypothetical protein SAMN05421847_0404 [Halpernia humi]